MGRGRSFFDVYLVLHKYDWNGWLVGLIFSLFFFYFSFSHFIYKNRIFIEFALNVYHVAEGKK